MTKTSLDVTTEALQHIGVLGIGEAPEAEDHARAQSHLADIFETISSTHELAPEWDIETVPSGAFLPLAIMLAGTICTAYGKPEFQPEYKRGLGLVREFMLSETYVKSQAVRASYF